MSNSNELFFRSFPTLCVGLADRDVNFQLTPHLDGFAVLVRDENGLFEWDAVCHSTSYGHEDGLLETYGAIVDESKVLDTVEGWLTAEDVLARVDQWLKTTSR